MREKYAEKLKGKFSKKKTDYGDAHILSKIRGEVKVFKEVTPPDVEFKPLLMIERALMDEVQGLYGRRRLGIDVEDEIGGREERLTRARGDN